MKKFISILSLTIGMLVSVTAFMACGGDDDENIISSPDSQEAVKSKHITRVDYQGWDMEYVINYDSKGRVSSYFVRDGKDPDKVNISYDENTIVHGNKTYYLLNGLITSSDDYSFSYDSSNHLIKKIGIGIGSRSISYTWVDNNLASFVITSNSSTQTVKLEYSDIKVPVNYIPFLFYVGHKLLKRNDPFLSYYGYFGENSQNLAKKMVETQGNTSATEEYDYTMKDGLPIEIAVKTTTISSNGKESTSNDRIIIEWN